MVIDELTMSLKEKERIIRENKEIINKLRINQDQFIAQINEYM